MSTNILADIVPKLGEQIASATEQQRRAASLAACRWEIERAALGGNATIAVDRAPNPS
jgi:hypothetical protein